MEIPALWTFKGLTTVAISYKFSLESHRLLMTMLRILISWEQVLYWFLRVLRCTYVITGSDFEIPSSYSCPDLLCRLIAVLFFPNQHVYTRALPGTFSSVSHYCSKWTSSIKNRGRNHEDQDRGFFCLLSISQNPVICGQSSASLIILMSDFNCAKCSEVIKIFMNDLLNSKHFISPLRWLKYRPPISLYIGKKVKYVTWWWENQRIHWEGLLFCCFLLEIF